MLRYFPFGDGFDAGMGGRALSSDEPLVDVESQHYPAQIALKRGLLTRAPQDYFRATPEAAEWEVLELLLTDLVRHYPDWFELERRDDEALFHNRLLGEKARFRWSDPGSLPLNPVDWVGRHVQEDLLLVRADDAGTFVGGQLCFPNGWDIAERVGQSFASIHQSTAASTMPAVHAGGRLLRALKPDRTFCRLGWNIKLTAQLDLSPKHRSRYLEELAVRAPLLDIESVGRETFLRIERQTFTRLTRSPHVLFGIHTYLSSIEEEARDPGRARRLLRVFREAPEDVKRYKALAAIGHALFPYLERQLEQAEPRADSDQPVSYPQRLPRA